MIKTKIEHLHIPKQHRIIAVSDIHGHLTLFRKLLDKIGFCDADELFIIGDFLEKGPDNLQILRYMMELDKRPNVHVMMGNLEYFDYRLLFDDEHAASSLKWSVLEYEKLHGAGLYGDMLHELGIAADEHTDFLSAVTAIRDAFAPELDFLFNLPSIIETDNLIFVHGGIPSEDVSSFAGLDVLQFLKNDNFVNQGLSFSKYVIVGHWPTLNYHQKPCHLPLVSEAQRIVSIDGGRGPLNRSSGSQLNALIITDERTFTHHAEYIDDFPICRALDSQWESEDFINIGYIDRFITVLEENGDKVYAEHIASGSKLWIPKENVWYDGDAACARFTNYELAVDAGDLLGLCRETKDGYYVKKNGVCGWYRGRVEML